MPEITPDTFHLEKDGTTPEALKSLQTSVPNTFKSKKLRYCQEDVIPFSFLILQ